MSSKARKSITKKKVTKKKKPVSAGRVSSLAFQLGKEIWPVERDVLFRPDRLKYVRKLIKHEGCVFCEANQSAASFESLLVDQSEHSMIVLNKFPYNPGHLLVLPRRHCGNLLELSEIEYFDLHQMLKRAFAGLEKAYNPGGINLGLNHGAVAGAGLPDHLHYHLVPRWSGDLNFFPLIAETKAIPTSLEETYGRIREVLKS